VFATERYLDTWYAHLDLRGVEQEVERQGRRLFSAEMRRARERTGYHAFPNLVQKVDGRYRIADNPPLIEHYPTTAEQNEVRRVFERFRRTLTPDRRRLLERYHLVDVAIKVVGVGSVGTRCSVGLFLADDDVLDPLFLQVKEALPSAYEPYLGASHFATHGERVVVGQRLIQEASDIFLGWGEAEGRDYYVRQLRDMKFSSDLMSLGRKTTLGQAELCGAALARAHARTGDPAAIAGYLGRGEAFDRAVTGFAEAYARQVVTDYHELVRAIAQGRVAADPGTGAATQRPK
jgi:uncharacterized protein (DUF2252 family)